MAAAKQKPAAFADRLGSLKQSRESVQAEMRQAHDDIQRKLADLREQRQDLASALATPDEIVQVATKALDQVAESFDSSQTEYGLGRMKSELAARMLRPPRTEGLEGPQNMLLREAAARDHKALLFSALFRADITNPRDELNAGDVLRFMCWISRDEIVQRVQQFAQDLPDRSDQGVREAELGRLDAEITDLEEQAAQMRREASEAGLHLEAA